MPTEPFSAGVRSGCPCRYGGLQTRLPNGGIRGDSWMVGKTKMKLFAGFSSAIGQATAAVGRLQSQLLCHFRSPRSTILPRQSPRFLRRGLIFTWFAFLAALQLSTGLAASLTPHRVRAESTGGHSTLKRLPDLALNHAAASKSDRPSPDSTSPQPLPSHSSSDSKVESLESGLRELKEVVERQSAKDADQAGNRIEVGGAVRFQYALEDYNAGNRDRGGDLDFDIFRLDLDGTVGGVKLLRSISMVPIYGRDSPCLGRLPAQRAFPGPGRYYPSSLRQLASTTPITSSTKAQTMYVWMGIRISRNQAHRRRRTARPSSRILRHRRDGRHRWICRQSNRPICVRPGRHPHSGGRFV